ncbi:MAG: hypothetical protein J7K31_00855 [Candidatus Aenigmarchaeota archaeon]|nr:hypothetical protein [Candidatus Aenigmarchaeota archaeon]OYT57510.1 MAG: hypothetical protein B6U68_01755 [Candidatus Aenigmarchaeota archaeon ex4484_14]RLI97463.1 MAG: hypothetical protein DRO96_00555 [Candidatus Aenigmarchaeota archaeon]
MKLLFIHSEWMKYEVRKKTKIAQRLEEKDKKKKFGQVLVVKICAESKDENKDDILEKTARNIKDIAKKVGESNIVLFPFAHLSDDLSNPVFALELIKNLKKCLEKSGYIVDTVPFGWVKKWSLETKGHPLAVLSRRL